MREAKCFDTSLYAKVPEIKIFCFCAFEHARETRCTQKLPSEIKKAAGVACGSGTQRRAALRFLR